MPATPRVFPARDAVKLFGGAADGAQDGGVDSQGPRRRRADPAGRGGDAWGRPSGFLGAAPGTAGSLT